MKIALSKKIFLFLVLFISACSSIFAGGDEQKISKYLKNENFVWKKYATENFDIYVEDKSFAEENIASLKTRMEEIRKNTLSFMGVEAYPKRISVFLVNSREKMKKLVGNEHNGVAYPNLQTLFAVYSPTLSAVGNHEPFHIFANNLWNIPKETFISEGMAVYSNDMWHSYALHRLAKSLKDNNKLIPFKNLIKDFRSQNDLISYPQSGSFIKFLIEKYGKEKIKQIWLKKAKDFKKVYSKNLTELEKEWLEFVDKQDASGIKYVDLNKL